MSFVENVNTLAAGLTTEAIADIRVVVTHLDEILLADDNAAIATDKALEASISAANALASEATAASAATAASISEAAAEAAAASILDLTVTSETLAFGEPIAVTYDASIGELSFKFPTLPLDAQWRAEEW